jgi:predicted DCC family thiol-disulfide oxidoreductase YuxK
MMDREPLLDPAGPVLLYDGTCGLCTRLVQWVLRTDRHGVVRFASLQGELARRARLRHPELEQADSIVWLEPADGSTRALLRSDAVLQVWTYLGGRWRLLARVARWLPRSLRDWLYDRVAIRRKKWFGAADACELPTPAQRGRMLE